MTRRLPRLLVALACLSFMSSSLRASPPLEALLELIPADAVAVIAAPNLRAASDDFATSVEAMDRGDLLLGSKPLDQLKAMLGFSVGVNDLGGAAVALMPHENDGGSPADRNLIAIVAVTDVDTFVKGNFVSIGDGGANGATDVVHTQWGRMYAKWSQTHVALSPRRELLERIGARDQEESFAAKRLGAPGLAAARRGEVFVYIDRSACGIHEMIPSLRRLVAMIPAMPAMESIVVSIDFDPLGWFVRGRTVFPDASEEGLLATKMSESRTSDAVLTGAELRVPDRPFILAGGVNASLVTHDVASAWTGKAWVRRALEALAPARSADFAAYPADGHLLNGAFLVLRGDDQARLAASLRSLVDGHADEQTTVQWRGDRFEVRRGSSTSPLDAVVYNMLFGAAGARGVIGEEERAAFLAMSERRATIDQAREAASGRVEPLARNPVVESMRSWMPRNRDVEVYLDPAALFTRFDQTRVPIRLPKFEPDQPPVGFAMGFEPAAVSYTLIVPSAVLAPIIDSQVERSIGRVLGNRRSPRP